TLERLGSAPRSTLSAGAGWDGIEHRQLQLRIRWIGWTGTDDQRDAVRVGHDLPFTPLFPAIGGVRPGVGSPFERPHRRAIDHRTFEVNSAVPTEHPQELLVQLGPDLQPGPIADPPPAGAAT